MRIKSIEITNFRGFEHQEVFLNKDICVVIGNNTAGKTTLLKALQIGLGAFLQSMDSLPGGKAYLRNFSAFDVLKKYDSEKKDYLSNKENPSIRINAQVYSNDYEEGVLKKSSFNEISWIRKFKGTKTSHTRQDVGNLIDFVKQMEKLRNEKKHNAILPLLLSFGAKRTSDAQLHNRGKAKERLSRVAKAYKLALHDKVDYEGAQNWLKHYDKDITDGKEFLGTRESFFDALQKAIPALSEIDFDRGEIEAIVSVTGHEPSRHHLSYMSDGLQSMVNIVSEIAHRCIELNGFLGKSAVSETPGVVIIDEVDLYLHPRWQRHVLKDLHSAFPKIQFVVSTHSPFIVQSLDSDDCLISFDHGVLNGGTPFKEGLEDIAQNRMGMPQEIRSKKFMEMENAAKELFDALDNHSENIDSLKERLDRLEAEYSDDPAYLALIRSEYRARTKSKGSYETCKKK